MAAAERPDSPPAMAVDPEETIDLLLRHLGTQASGLSALEAGRRLEQHGLNEIRRHRGPGHLAALTRQFTNPLALLLWVAGALALLADLAPLAIAIVAVIVLNAVFAFFQELQAEHATEALREFLPPHARVRRGGRETQVDARELVPGDVLLLDEGDRLSADARLFQGGIEVDMSPLTGEAQPVVRSAARRGPPASPLESDDLVFAGTLCTGGQAIGVVFATGMATQLGRIAALSQRVHEDLSPLQREVNRAAQLIAGLAVAFGIVFLLIGTTIAGLPLDDAAPFTIGLIVANVPEGLLPTITLALAVGVRRMARRRALIKRLTAVETLGSTDVICTDKTGTITSGEMSVRCFWSDGRELRPVAERRAAAAREPFSALLRTAVRCNNASAHRSQEGWERSGDPGESALLVAAASLGVDVDGLLGNRESDRLRVFGFDPRVKRMTTADAEPGGALWLHSKGAPLELLDHCTAVRGSAGDRRLTPADREAVAAAFRGYAQSGLRVLGFAERRIHRRRAGRSRGGRGRADVRRAGRAAGPTARGGCSGGRRMPGGEHPGDRHLGRPRPHGRCGRARGRCRRRGGPRDHGGRARRDGRRGARARAAPPAARHRQVVARDEAARRRRAPRRRSRRRDDRRRCQ